MARLKPLPAIWLISDARNDAVLEAALCDLASGSGFVFRHYHLEAPARQARFTALRNLCRERGHLCVLSGDVETALAWGADGAYGPPDGLEPRDGLLRFATVHDACEVSQANRAQVDGMFLSPAYPSRTHPEGQALGKARFHQLAARAESPVVALGGMDAARAGQLDWPRWAAIDAFLR